MKPTGSPGVVLHIGHAAGKKMAEDTLTTVGIGRHGAARLPSVDDRAHGFNWEKTSGARRRGTSPSVADRTSAFNGKQHSAQGSTSVGGDARPDSEVVRLHR